MRLKFETNKWQNNDEQTFNFDKLASFMIKLMILPRH